MNKEIKDILHKHMMEEYKQKGYTPPPVDTMKSHAEKELGLLRNDKVRKTSKKPRSG